MEVARQFKLNQRRVCSPVGCLQVSSEIVQNVSCADKPALLDPAESFSCSGHYVLTQKDGDEGTVTNEVRLSLL